MIWVYSAEINSFKAVNRLDQNYIEFTNTSLQSHNDLVKHPLLGKSLFALSENYPELKSNENFIQFQNRISSIEDDIADRREFYNDSVNNFNIRIESAPDVIVANYMGLKEQEMFEVPESKKEDVQIDFSDVTSP